MKAQSSPPPVRALRGPFVRLFLLPAALLMGMAAVAQANPTWYSPPNFPGASTPASPTPINYTIVSGRGPLNIPVVGAGYSPITGPSYPGYNQWGPDYLGDNAYYYGWPNGMWISAGNGVSFWWTQNTDQLFYETYLAVFEVPSYNMVFDQLVVNNTDYYSNNGYLLTAAIPGSGITSSPALWYDYSFHVGTGPCDHWTNGLPQEYYYEIWSYQEPLIAEGAGSSTSPQYCGVASGYYWISVPVE